MIEGQDGLTWPRWQGLVDVITQLGFAGLYRSDHFTNSAPPDKDSLELWVSLAYLASHSHGLKFGSLVCPLTFRHPAMIARQAAALDDLSGGRMVLGVGAGWQAREHELFGLELPELSRRFDRLEEGLEVATRLLRETGPVTFTGRYFRLEGAELLPHPQRPGGPAILVGGNGPRRTIPLAAKYADAWNAIFLPPGDFAQRNEMLDELAKGNGRKPTEIKRTMMTGLVFATDAAGMDAGLARFADNPRFEGRSASEIVNYLRSRGMVVGTPSDMPGQLDAFARSGLDELMLQWLELDDLEGLNALREATR